MNIRLPVHKDVKKALFIVNVQPATFVSEIPRKLIAPITEFIQAAPYDAYVVGEYEADENSMFARQSAFIFPFEKTGRTAPALVGKITATGKPTLYVEKNTRSFFKSRNALELDDFLKREQIGEIHLIGCDINDCVLSTAYSALDSGFYTYVIEELCHNYRGKEEMKNAALAILREQNMTNNSVHSHFETAMYVV